MKKPKGPTPRSKTTGPRRRKQRPRPTPKWLKERVDLDEIARRRCLLVLSVLSGEKPVTAAIEAEQISRQLYYQLEERALGAMLLALTPGSEETSRADSPAKRIAELEEKVRRLEQDKRRGERLLLLTRKVIKGPVKTAAGRPRKTATASSSTSAGKKRSQPSATKTVAATPLPLSASTPTPAGEVAPSLGRES